VINYNIILLIVRDIEEMLIILREKLQSRYVENFNVGYIVYKLIIYIFLETFDFNLTQIIKAINKLIYL